MERAACYTELEKVVKRCKAGVVVATAQTAMLNVRMDRQLKDAGDVVLAEMGVSASDVTRALWKKLAEGGSDARQQVERLLAPSSTGESLEEARRKRASFAQIDKSWEQLLEVTSIDASPAVNLPDDKDALAEERYTYLQEKWGELS